MARPRLKPALLHLLFLCLLHIHLARAIPWQGPTSTSLPSLSASGVTPGVSESTPSATPAPQLPIDNGNATYELPNLCGYINYDSQNSYTCADQNTCLWNAAMHLVGCGSPSAIAFYTSCVPFRQATFCSSDPSCISNPSIIHCPSDAPFCATARIGPRTDIYSILACQSYRDFGQLRVQLSHSSQISLAHIPRFLGFDGNITYATLTPSPITSPTPLPPPPSPTFGSGEINPATVPGGLFTVVVPVTGQGGCNASCRAEGEERDEEMERKRVLAAGIVGGCMVFVVVAFVGWMAWAWRKRRRDLMREEGGPGGSGSGSGGFVMQDVSVNAGRERQGEGKTESENDDGTARTRTWTPSLEDT